MHEWRYLVYSLSLFCLLHGLVFHVAHGASPEHTSKTHNKSVVKKKNKKSNHSAHAPSQDEEIIEPISIETVPDKKPSLQQSMTIWLGHMHAAFVHFPIAWSVLWCLLQYQTTIIPISIPLLAVFSFVPAIFSGLLRAQEVGNPESMAAILLHRNIMYLSMGLSVVLLIKEFLYRKKQSSHATEILYIRKQNWYYTLVLIFTLLVCYGAHLGGVLVYGADFLPF
jgi:hypothetical protein